MSTNFSTCFDDRAKLAWVAGLLEGEGCFSIKSGQRIKVHCNTTDEDIAKRLTAWTGLGKVYGPYFPRRENRKPVWEWQLNKQADAEILCTALLPLMGQRRAIKISMLLAARRAPKPRRVSCRRKLTPNQVREIRKRQYQPKLLAEEFGVGPNVIRKLRKGEHYREIA